MERGEMKRQHEMRRGRRIDEMRRGGKGEKNSEVKRRSETWKGGWEKCNDEDRHRGIDVV